MKNKKKNQQFLWLLWYIVFGVICGVLFGYHMRDLIRQDMSFGKYMLSLCVLILEIYLALFLHIVIHEAGHLVFGLLTGYRFSSFRIANLMWIKENGKIRLKRYSLAGTGGQCLLCAPDMKDGKIPFVLYNLGGSLMNLMTAALFAGLYWLCTDWKEISMFCLLMCVSGIFLGLMNGIPMRMGTVDNDGYNALSMGKSPAALRAFWIQMKINEQMSVGVRAKDMPEEWFFLPEEADMQNSMCAAIGVAYASRLMDCHNFAEAAAVIDQLNASDNGVVGLHSSLLICDRIFCELVGNRDTQMIEQMLTKNQLNFMKQMKNYLTVIRTEYALALLYEKDEKKAAEIRKRFDKYAAVFPYGGDVESEYELIQTAENQFCNGLCE